MARSRCKYEVNPARSLPGRFPKEVGCWITIWLQITNWGLMGSLPCFLTHFLCVYLKKEREQRKNVFKQMRGTDRCAGQALTVR